VPSRCKSAESAKMEVVRQTQSSGCRATSNAQAGAAQAHLVWWYPGDSGKRTSPHSSMLRRGGSRA